MTVQRIRHAVGELGRFPRNCSSTPPRSRLCMIRELHGFGLHLEGVVRARQVLVDTGFAPPSWDDLENGLKPTFLFDDDDPTTLKHGWQHLASQAVNAHLLGAQSLPRLPKASRALLRTQSGPMTSAPFTCCPTAHRTRRTTHRHPAPPPLVAPSTQRPPPRSRGVAGSQWSQQQHACVAKGADGSPPRLRRSASPKSRISPKGKHV